MRYFVGWDVGGWNCDNNPNSRDALAVLSIGKDSKLAVVGQVFRNNIREHINKCDELASIINACCKTQIGQGDDITIAIDTPLGLPDAIRLLLEDRYHSDGVPDDYSKNPYLYRKTERWLFDKECSPLSAIKDMIGSQATKGMHLLRKLGITSKECGIWTSGKVTAIETYPTPCKGSPTLAQMFSSLQQTFVTQDRTDAVYCGLVAHLFATDRNSLIGPVGCPSLSEGWIWIPADAVAN